MNPEEKVTPPDETAMNGTRARTLDAERDRKDLEMTWAPAPGLIGWFTDTNHKSIAMRYIITAFIFFLLGGILAALMRIQLALPHFHRARSLQPDFYHPRQHHDVFIRRPYYGGSGPIFCAIGTRNVAFPKLNAFGYYVYLMGGILLYGAFLLNVGPDTGWFSYVPLSGPDYSPGKRVDI
jgi:cytochrome c oxidase subunit 1